MDSENDNDKVNTPLFLSLEPTVSCINDLDFFKDFENEFPAIVYNDALTSKSDFSTKPGVSPQHIDKFDLKEETSLSECDEEEQNVLCFNDLFSFNVIYPDELKSDTDKDNDKIDIERSSGDMYVIPLPYVINTDIVLAGRQPGIYLSVIESVFPDMVYGVSNPSGYSEPYGIEFALVFYTGPCRNYDMTLAEKDLC
ncbi:hypothetical protein Tco_0059164 [Tanacetum coccineum]